MGYGNRNKPERKSGRLESLRMSLSAMSGTPTRSPAAI